jgi:ABC-type amino acid transport substrate-binding protein
MKLGADALKAVVDGSIEAAKADGRYDEIYAKWIGGTPPASSGSSTAPSSK